MTAAATQATPAIPPRPSRGGSDKESSGSSAPKIPPRPVKTRIERSVSPNSQRFAQSPFNEGNFPRPNANKPALLSPNRGLYEPVEDPIDRPGSVTMPGVGEEGMEYSAIASEAEDDKDQNRAASPEQTRTVGEGLELHAPRPSLPANSAKARVEAVTRTDSDRAASFGIGRPTSAGGNGRPISRQSVGDRATSREGVKKRPSTSFSTSSDHGHHDDEDHGIPEIGQRVPMNRNLGDVQAPSPGPENKRNHARKHSSRGLPPGSYGLHGHGVGPQDKLEKAYYEKHPELLQREEHTPLHDRQNDFAMSKEDLNRLVRDTASRGAGFGTTPEYRGTPTEEVGFQASEEYVRQSSPRPGSAQPKDGHRRSSSLAKVVSRDDVQQEHEDGAIHVDDARHPEYRSYGDEEAAVDDEDHEYHAPILASDEVQKNPGAYLQRPAVHPPPERRTSNYEAEEGQSRPLSRPTSLHREHSQSKEHSQPEIRYTPLEDVEEYEPLFSEETKNERQPIEHADENKHHNHFPSKDIWEDAPSSVHYTATVSTPDLPESEHHRSRSSGHHDDRPMTPAHAFAKHQEELAEREAKRRSGGSFLPLGHEQKLNNMPKPTWAGHQAHLKVERPASGPKFPSRDVWEDVPESQLHEAIISSPEEEKKPEIPSRPAKKSSDSSERPAVPTRPKPRQTSGDDSRPKPPVSDKPKPQIPARPAKSSSGDSAAKAKPPVPSRPVGSSKIAALQSGFINDLNQRLKIGPQVHKEKPKEEEVQEEKEKAPLSDARKGRARGPQRRAPAAKSPAPAAAAEEKPSKPTLSFSLPQSSWQIDDDGNLAIDEKYDEQEKSPIAKEDPPTKEEPPVAVTENPSVEDAEEKQIEPEPAAEPALAPDGPAVNAESQIPAEEAKAESPEAPAESVPKDDSDNEGKVEKTLVANMAGESILEATVDKKEGGDTVNPVEVDDAVKP